MRRRVIMAANDASSYSNVFHGLRQLRANVKRGDLKLRFNEKGQAINRKIIFGFLHPYAANGGGGERVLWAAVKQTLENSTSNICAIYVGENDRGGVDDSPSAILEKVDARFGITVDDKRVVFIYVPSRRLLDPQTWPRFTILGQAIGSMIFAYKAMHVLVPDVLVDTTGLPFAYPVVDWLLQIPICAYIHYPTVGPDMLKRVSCLSPKGVYWRIMMFLYAYTAHYALAPVTNSTWTNQHIKAIWKGHAARLDLIKTVYPPVATQDFEPPTPEDEEKRKPIVLYIAQFRPEKRHEFVLQEFANYVKAWNGEGEKPQLVFVGSVRNDMDSQHVYNLRLLARELGLTDDDHVTFILDAPWTSIATLMATASVGVNAMIEEHFGMGIVEYMAGGLIPIVHRSGGPMLDIVDEDENGYMFEKEGELTSAIGTVLALSTEDKIKMRQAAYEKAQNFSDEVFAKAWNVRVNALLKLDELKRRERLMVNYFD
ncbi:GDP-Man:Man(3)GlcNAc(2)-PP-Dol alpha-1,2-mannosyltransferase [Trichomonascus vanleenenianus]|uniref:alpha-1,2-mannosyltransferase ALG11 n=1 Tax=Trichomonascus vanleenenianus TaxID=2268995 RepID=UPI003EC9A183